MCKALEELMEDRVVAREKASAIARSEEIAKRLLKRKRPVSEIEEDTQVPRDRIEQLALELA